MQGLPTSLATHRVQRLPEAMQLEDIKRYSHTLNSFLLEKADLTWHFDLWPPGVGRGGSA
jgi:hypothetical protein